MGYYKDKMDTLLDSGNYDVSKLKAIIEMLDSTVMEHFRTEHVAEYWNTIRTIHEHIDGHHYDKCFADWEVSQMEHTDKIGKCHKGEHFCMKEITTIHTTHRPMFNPTDTIYDIYVALNSWWHDNICQDIEDFGDKAEEHNIKRAINYFFCDTDAPVGKIWHYYKGMHNV